LKTNACETQPYLSSEGILLEHPKNEKKSERNERVSQEDDLGRCRGPCESMIERRYNEDGGEGAVQ